MPQNDNSKIIIEILNELKLPTNKKYIQYAQKFIEENGGMDKVDKELKKTKTNNLTLKESPQILVTEQQSPILPDQSTPTRKHRPPPAIPVQKLDVPPKLDRTTSNNTLNFSGILERCF